MSLVTEYSSKVFPLPPQGSIRSRPKGGQSLTCRCCSYNFQHPLLILAKTSGNLVQDITHMVIFLASLLKGCRVSLSLSLLNLNQKDLSSRFLLSPEISPDLFILTALAGLTRSNPHIFCPGVLEEAGQINKPKKYSKQMG